MIASDLPAAYDSALSKKFTPASRAAVMHAMARSSSSWGPKVTQEPSESTLTLRPAWPSRRYCIFTCRILSSGTVPCYDLGDRPWSPPSGSISVDAGVDLLEQLRELLAVSVREHLQHPPDRLVRRRLGPLPGLPGEVDLRVRLGPAEDRRHEGRPDEEGDEGVEPRREDGAAVHGPAQLP